MSNFSDILIEEVKKREPLWNRTNENYKNRAVVDRGWESLAESLGRDKEKMKQKWRNLRDTYQRELRKMPRTPDGDLVEYTGKWAYFYKLSFLQEILLPAINTRRVYNVQRQDRNQSTLDDDCDDSEDFTEEPDSPNHSTIKIEPWVDTTSKPEVPQYTTRKRKADFDDPLEIEVEANTSLSRDIESAIDDDMCFVKSLVPYLKRLNPVRKLIVRNEMQKLLINQLLCEGCRTNGPRDNCSCCS